VTRKARILLADDHALVREALRRAIESEPDLEVVGEAANVAATIEQVSATRPDLLLLDVTMPGGGGIAALREIRKAGLPTRTLVLTMHEDPEYLRVSLIAGASGFILKHAAGREVVTAIRAVLQGRMYVDPTLAGVTLNEVLRPPPPLPSGPETALDRLSPREARVLRDLTLGFTNKEVAERLAVSVKSIETYRARLSQKLGLSRRSDLVRYAIAHNLIDLADHKEPVGA
jgi:two-component system, NarL family, response regulator NreC